MLFLAALFCSSAVSLSGPACARQALHIKKDSHQYGNATALRRLQNLDIYHHDSLQNAPVIIMVHGGAWYCGDKSDVDVGLARAKALVSLGCVYVSINYRLAPRYKHPCPTRDLASALAWTKKHIARYGGDASKIILVGHSAGGHIAALLISDPQYLKSVSLNKSAIKTVVLLDPAALDLEISGHRASSDKNKQLTDEFGTQSNWISASPLHQLIKQCRAKNSNTNNRKLPQLILVLSRDQLKNRSQATAYLNTYKDCGGQGQLIIAAHKDHAGILKSFGDTGELATKALMQALKQ